MADISKMFEIKDTEIDSKIIEDNGGVENGGARQAQRRNRAKTNRRRRRRRRARKGRNRSRLVVIAASRVFCR